VSSSLANNSLNLGIIGRYQHTFARVSFFVHSPSLQSSSLILYHDTPDPGHLRSYSNSFLYNMQSLGHACIFWYSIPIRHNIFFASKLFFGNMFSFGNTFHNTLSKSVKLLSPHPYFAPSNPSKLTPLTIMYTFCYPNTKVSLNHFLMYHA